MPNFRKKSLSLATAIAGVLTFGSMIGCSGTDNDTALETDAAPPSVVLLDNGDVNQFLSGTSVLVGRWDNPKAPTQKQFRGIKYAQAPTGARRFAAPVANMLTAGTSSSTYNYAANYGSGCPQPSSNGLFGSSSTTEDCLFLNVFTPSNASAGQNLPVMVWIHGGAYIYGNGGSSYDPSRLLSEGVIVVTLNYRLGALGFLAHSELTAENNASNGDLPGESGNYGLMDQRLALDWVKDNIARFGGDPANVTIFGESAGGQSVLSHMVSPEATGLFNKAIVQSGSYIPTQQTLASAQGLGSLYFARLSSSCVTDNAGTPDVNEAETTLQCLRNRTVAQILAAQSSYVTNDLGGNALFQATVGTNQQPQSIADAMDDGTLANEVPVIAGANLNEGTLFTAIGTSLTTEEAYNAKVAGLFAPLLLSSLDYDEVDIANDFLIRQDSGDSQRFNKAYSELYTQFAFTCNQYDQLQDLVAAGVTTYGYHFTDQQAYSPLRATAPYIGATHTAELQYLWTTSAGFTGSPRSHTTDQLTLSNQMIDYWTNFAKTGNPNAGALPTWSAFSNEEAMIQLNDPGATATSGATFASEEVHNCDYWDAANLNAYLAGLPD